MDWNNPETSSKSVSFVHNKANKVASHSPQPSRHSLSFLPLFHACTRGKARYRDTQTTLRI